MEYDAASIARLHQVALFTHFSFRKILHIGFAKQK